MTTRARTPPTKSGKVDETIKESFPASDAPASGLPDTPPVNADEKWAAAKAERRKTTAAPSPPIKAPNPPEEEVDDRNIPDEIPKMGSRDAPGG